LEIFNGYSTIVVGAGPSGLMAAIEAIKNGPVLVIEKMPKVGLKLLSTGGGRCNLTNTSTVKELVNSYKKKSTIKALTVFTPKDVERFFNNLGVETVCEDGFHIFPKSQKADDILSILIKSCDRKDVKILKDCTVNKVLVDNNTAKGVSTNKGEFLSKKVIVATGGKSYTQFGTTGDGYQFAKNSDHHITELNPMLGGLFVKNSWKAKCSGLVIKNVLFKVESSKKSKINIKSKGDILFTHRGVSGPVCLDISGEIASLLKKNDEVKAFVDLTVDISQEEWFNKINSLKNERSKKTIKILLQEYFTKSFVDILLEESIGNNKKILDLSKKEINKLINNIKLFSLTINGTDGYKKSMLTMGGVDIKDINMSTMESKKVKGLYFVGEVLDINGPCGGYNLQWAFSSGFLAGNN